ncbi:MAG: hypothetical protein QOF69_3547, partial [Solirubrobacteraceae bacterium]|nr:hypothetical protein [Solirubrobacteraceae bacterium]
AAAVTLDDEDMNALEHVRQVGNPLEAVQD